MGRKKRFARGKGGAPWKANKDNGSGKKDGNQKTRSAAEQPQQPSSSYVKYATLAGNVKMEAYYAAQGLHHSRWASSSNDDDDAKAATTQLVPCATVDEFNAERLAWRECMCRILPASFRFSKEVTLSLKKKMERQLLQILQTALQEETADDAAAANQAKQEPNSKEEQEVAATEVVEVKQDEAEAEEDKATRRQRSPEPHVPLAVLLAQHQPHGVGQQRPNNDASVSASASQLLHKLPFCEFAYQLGLDRHAIRKHPRLKALHQWIKEQQDCGHLTRQETVSMIPPVVLNVRYSDAVLDLCAAPGSKTSQLLEKLGPQALLVANDANPDRAFMLTHQLKRLLHNTFPITLVTACQAQFFPSSTRGGGGGSNNDQKNNDETLPVATTVPALLLLPKKKAEALQLFDRILADVPCTGDGTTRKNIHVWKQWTQQAALSLHPLQLDIAWKGASQLLKTPLDNNNSNSSDNGEEGGYMCYSTCSLNPIEDEAVVAELLRRAKGSLELVPIPLSSSSSDRNDGDDKNDADSNDQDLAFRTRPGMSYWKVFCEIASKRERKDAAKKNNEKMQQRRRLEQEKIDGTNANDKKVDEANGSNLDDSGSKPSASSNDVPETEAATSKADKDGHQIVQEAAAAAASAPDTFEPASMHEADLIAIAEAAGLKYMPTLADVPEHLTQRVRPSCFPPTPEEAEQFHLERCMRCLPQDNDTGGFFVALLRKVGPISKGDYRRQGEVEDAEGTTSPEPKRVKLDVSDEEKKQAVAVNEDDDDEDNEGQENIDMIDVEGLDADNIPVTKKLSRRQRVDERFIAVEDQVLDPLIEYYGLAGPDFRKDLFMTRANGDSKVIYYLSAPVKNLLDRGIQDRVQVIASGLKAFCRNSTQHQCDVTHRIAQDAVYFVSQYMTKRKFVVNMHDFIHCLNVSSAKPVALTEGFSDKFAEAVRPIEVGAFVIDLEGFENKGIDKKMAITMWRCRGDKISLLVTKVEVDSIKDKLQVIQEEKEEEEQKTKV